MLILGSAPRLAFAQVQSDAALAEAPDDKPPAQSTSTNTVYAPSRPAPPEVDLDPPLTTAELRAAHPDLRVRVTPPPALTLGLTSVYPFQAFGLGMGFDVYALPRLRLSVVADLGALPVVNSNWRLSFYGEAGLGVVILRGSSEVTAEIKALPTALGRNFHSTRSAGERFLLGDEQPPPGSFVRATLPAFHSLELEGGLFSGPYALYRCVANCAENPNVVAHTKEDATGQLGFLYAGLRYVYFRWADSERVPFVTRFQFDAAVDAITNPFWKADPTLFNMREQHPAQTPVGVRVQLRLVGVKCGSKGGCLGFDLMGGYLPAPNDALISVGLMLR